jgi:transcription antitermination protein NusB
VSDVTPADDGAGDPSPPRSADHGGRPLATSRSEARERALHLLYEAESRSEPPATVLAAQVLQPDAFTASLVGGVDAHQSELDTMIAARSRGWALDRMPAIDRAVLRLATYELVYQPDVPTAVVIDEAVELAKRYSTEDSGRFVNGVLAALAGEIRG